MGAIRAMGTTLEKLPNANLGETETLVIGNLTSIGAIGMESEEIDCTDLDSPYDYKEFIAGAKTPTDIDIEGNVKDEADLQKLLTLADARTIETWQVTYPTGAKWVFQAYVKSFTDGDKTTDGLITFNTGLRVTGKPTFTPSYSTLLAYTVRYYLTSSQNVAFEVELPKTKYPANTVINEAKVTADLGEEWITRYQPPTYSNVLPVSYPTLSGVSSNDIVKVVYTESPLDSLAVTSSPLNNATDVLVSANVVLSFNYEIAECPNPILMVQSTSTPVACAYAWDTANKVLTINPNSNLTAGTTYTLTIQGATDVYNRTLAGTVIVFTTAS